MNIDKIMNLLDEHQPKNLQEEGLKQASKIKNISVFLQPYHPNYNKNVWNNCALVLSNFSDEDLLPHLENLLLWIKDLDNPGATTILNRMKKMNKKDYIYDYCLEVYIKLATILDNEKWLNALNEIRRN